MVNRTSIIPEEMSRYVADSDMSIEVEHQSSGSVIVDVKNFTIDLDYKQLFDDKRRGLHDMVKDGDGFTREEIHDLVKTANEAVSQQSVDK